MPFPISKTALGIIIAVLTAFVYGFHPSATRAAYADGANAIFLILLMGAIRGFVFTTFCFVTKRQLFIQKIHTKIAISNGFFQALASSAVLISMLYIPGPITIIILFTYPLMLYSFMVFKGTEPLNLITIFTVILTISGLILVLDLHADVQILSFIGVTAAFVAALATASRLYVLGNILRTRDAPTVGTEAYLFALIFSGLFLFYEDPLIPLSIAGWGWALLSALTSTIGGLGLLYSVQLIGAFRFSFISKLEPVFAAIFAAVLINEILSVAQYIGIAIVIASLIFYQAQQAHKQKA